MESRNSLTATSHYDNMPHGVYLLDQQVSNC